ncbi:MAG: signal peptidase I [Candidatus Omnitrophica bacterium]|nr:signal peptidase I [Candidatus Omnitrophota bacterium]
MTQQQKSTAREWVESIVVAFFLAMFIRTFVIQAFKIPTGSMRPTLVEGDLILVNKFLYGAKVPLTEKMRLPAFAELERGDVIVFVYPEDGKKAFIKRLVAFEGETVEIIKGTIYINGKPLLEPEFSKVYYYNRGDLMGEGEQVTVPENSYFVLGDNSASSKDSRYWGVVPHRNLLGKATLIYWPLPRIRMIR